LSRFAIVNPGLLTTFQDLGRREMLRYALAASGAMDQDAVKMINLLLGNPETAATLETTMMGLKLRVLSKGMIAVGGADQGCVINGKTLPMWTVIPVKAGDVIAFSGLKSGMRAYLGVAGGFDAPPILGSRSTYLRGSLGAALKKGDEIRSLRHQGKRCETGRSLPPGLLPNRAINKPFRVLPGPQLDYFSEDGIRTFTASTYTVSPVSDRQGIRTEGPPVERVKGPDIITDPTPMGAVQVPGSGVPIILHRDAQVTGGYAKIAIMCKVDIDRAAQLCPGDSIQFEFIDRPTALSLLEKKKQQLEAIKKSLRF
jgi:biotin-dependent carboxylase-like uncharacterized protein